MRVAAVIVFLSEERAQLTQWARSKTVSVRLSRRAQIVLGAADGLDNETIAAQLGLGRVQVGRCALGIPREDWRRFSRTCRAVGDL